MPQSFAERLRRSWLMLQAAEGRELDQVELAKRVGKVMKRTPVVQASVSRWFRGTVPDVATVAALAEVLHVDPGWLAFGTERPAGTSGAVPGGVEPEVLAAVQRIDREQHRPPRGSGRGRQA